MNEKDVQALVKRVHGHEAHNREYSLSRSDVRRLVGALEVAWKERDTGLTAVAQTALDTVEHPCLSKDVGAPGSLMRRANDLGRRLSLAEAYSAEINNMTHEATPEEQERIRGILAKNTRVDVWEDVQDEWSDAIRASHPTRTDTHEEYGVAMRMVNHRHSKGALVALAHWLLVTRRQAREEALAQGRAVLDETKAQKNRAVLQASNAEDVVRQVRDVVRGWSGVHSEAVGVLERVQAVFRGGSE